MTPRGERLQRRRERTRSALIGAAQVFLAEDRTDVPVLTITETADVGMGSFYNHFASKEALFEAAVADALEQHGALMDTFTADLDDPAERFACSFRLTGRLHRRASQLSKILINVGPRLTMSDHGLGPRALRDIKHAVEGGRFTVADPEIALAMAAGSMICLGQLLHHDPSRDDAAAADQMTEDLLRAFGLSPADAHAVATRPLPDLGLDAAWDLRVGPAGPVAPTG